MTILNQRQTFLFYRVLFLLILGGSFYPVRAQPNKPFPTDTLAFAESFHTFMSAFPLNEKQEQMVTRFINMVASDSMTVSPANRKQILYTLNRLKSRKARQVPHFINYLETIELLSDKYPGEEYFNAWERGLIELLNNKRVQLRYIQRYLTGVIDFLQYNSLYLTPALSWIVKPVPFKFKYDHGFYILLPKTTLTCHAQHDSINILETAGRFEPYTGTWYGKSGKVTWVRAGYEADSVYAELPAYKITLTKPGYHVDSVSFINKTYLGKPVLGQFEDKATRISSPEKATYPKFDSYVKRFQIKNLYPDVDYEGGFSMQGAVINGTGNINQLASLRFYQHDTIRLLVKSIFFAIHKDRISGRETSISFYLKKDSIFHPNIAFTFYVPTREVSLYQTDNIMTTSPYYDTYHNLNITANRFVWYMDKPLALFTRLRGTTIGEGHFWSTSFFNANTYYKMQYMESQHPLYLLKKFAEWYYSKEFPVEELAKWMKKPAYQVRRLVVQLAVDGFVFYNPETGDVTLKKELYDYLNAYAGKIDYDVMSFLSHTHAPVDNAELNLDNLRMTINGVPTIFLSDSQKVAIFPTHHRIIMHKNRSFSFDGRIQAGMTILYGKKFFFNYDSFKISLHKIDSMRFSTYGEKKDNLGNPVPEKINNILELVTGDIYIDAPDNKSGIKHYDKYPFFNSIDSSFVYYNKSSIYDSVYTRKNFHFVIEPFTLHSLNNLYKKDLSFKGDFISGDIFPPIPQQLKVQEDNSLGFISRVPEGGLTVYNGKGKYFNEVKMSNQGLEGSGKLTYLSSTVLSDHFSFFPDSMITDAHDFTIKSTHEGTRYPDVTARDIHIKWQPKQDQFHVYKKTSDIALFNNRYVFNGDMTLSPDNLTANGVIRIPESNLSSTQFILTDTDIHADTANLVIYGSTPGQANRLQTNLLKIDVNVPGQVSYFQTLTDTIPVDFPDKQWITSLDRFSMDMKTKQIILNNGKTSDDPYLLGNDPLTLAGKWIKMPTFISMNPKADTLGFYADSARYDLSTGTIETFHTRFIEIADALIYPNGQTLQIEQNGILHKLTDARLVADNIYTLDSANINIFSGKDFYGSGTYHYIEENGGSEDIFFSDVKVDDSLYTYGTAKLPPEKHFLLSPDFEYTGKVELFAARDHLLFSGGVRVIHQCQKLSRSYLAFSAEIDPQNILIPVGDKIRDINHKRIYSGHFITNDSIHIYPAFLSGRKNYSDILISSAKGVLYFDKKTGEYRIGSEEKVHNPSLPGNYISLNRNYCKLYGEGKLNPGVNFGQVKMVSIGNILQEMENDNKVTLHLMIGFDFYFNTDALKIMTGKIDSLTNLQPVDIRNAEYKKMAEEIGTTENVTHAVKQEMKLFGQFPVVPPGQKHTLFLSVVTMGWNPETNSYLSTGKIGIGNIDGHPLNVMVDGYFEIRKKRSGDMFDLYLKLNDKDYYYFGYTTGVMQALSNNPAFATAIQALKPGKRSLKVRSGQTPYIYMVGVGRKKDMFLRRMNIIKEGKGDGASDENGKGDEK